jgi:hypothetical protein
MSRDPRQRYASAREFADALRAVQAELGISPTPLEIAADGWSAASGPVDFSDTALRGPARSRIDRDERRKTRPGAGMAALARDEETDFTGPEQPRRVMPWVIGAAIAAVVAVGGILTALLATGVL